MRPCWLNTIYFMFYFTSDNLFYWLPTAYVTMTRKFSILLLFNYLYNYLSNIYATFGSWILIHILYFTWNLLFPESYFHDKCLIKRQVSGNLITCPDNVPSYDPSDKVQWFIYLSVSHQNSTYQGRYSLVYLNINFNSLMVSIYLMNYGKYWELWNLSFDTNYH